MKDGYVLAELPVTDLRHVLFEITMFRYARLEAAMYPHYKASSPEILALRRNVYELKKRNSVLIR